ncbi:hypothetical protein H5T09_23365 [Escherichia coli]|nr:hypothetical protein [Escherichia coli]MBZ8732362.1 hypothetical protein [Escherichia coli]MBZ8737768.1 hypothetical protein [Escherichia coli]MBZ8742831.1 hypothetical protein [Escherichia coli]MBZ8748039.1 hypothetical protein [Escherichia coli]
MKLKLLSAIALVSTFLITGCDGEDKTDCKKDPTAKGCPHYSGNITHSENKSWGMNKEENSFYKEDK